MAELHLARDSHRSGDEGWTLIELLVVITLIMLLASISLVQYRNTIVTAKEAVLKSQIFITHDAIEQYHADKGTYPESLQTLVSEQYLRSVPVDPFTESSDTWQTVAADREAGAATAAAGIFAVRSGSDRIALDGSRYADWHP